MNHHVLTYIYGLVDPRNPEEIRYVGKTDWMNKRLIGHLQEARKRDGYKNNWIKSLLAEGVTPKMVLLSVVPAREWQEHERRLIAQYSGPRLTNGTAGGYGGMQTEAVRAKMSESRKRAAARMGKELSAEQNRRWADPAYREKQRLAHIGKKHSPEFVAKRIAFRIGMKDSPETIAKRRASLVKIRGFAVINVETGERFDCSESAARSVNGDSPNIRRSANTGTKAYGFHWKRTQNGS